MESKRKLHGLLCPSLQGHITPPYSPDGSSHNPTLMGSSHRGSSPTSWRKSVKEVAVMLLKIHKCQNLAKLWDVCSAMLILYLVCIQMILQFNVLIIQVIRLCVGKYEQQTNKQTKNNLDPILLNYFQGCCATSTRRHLPGTHSPCPLCLLCQLRLCVTSRSPYCLIPRKKREC